jgi:uncharacterized membrane protein YccC
MVWTQREWKQALNRLTNKYRSVVAELFEAVASEENRLARMEMDGRLQRATIGSDRKDMK